MPEPKVIKQSRLVRSFLEAVLALAFIYLRTYQIRFIMDQADSKIAMWARQTGKSVAVAFEALLLALSRADHEVLIVSASRPQADELMLKVVKWADLMDEAAKKILGRSIYADGFEPTVNKVVLFNGSRVISLSANPRTAAGYTGDVIWDEAAKAPWDRSMYEALYGITTSNNYKFRMVSTPWGDRGEFHKTWKGEERPGWAHHKVTILAACKEGLARDLAKMEASVDWLTWKQDYLCEFVGGLTSVFPYELVQAATRLDWGDLPNPDAYLKNGKPDLEEREAAALVKWALGVDIGRYEDLTAMAWCAEFPRNRFRVDHVDRLRNELFQVQRRWVEDAIRNKSRRIRQCWVDRTGLGMQIAEELELEFPAVVEGKNFSEKDLKENIVTTLLKLMQKRRLLLTPDNDLLSDFTAIRKTPLPGGKMRYDAARDERGHADSFWAAGLGILSMTDGPKWRIDGVDVGGSDSASQVDVMTREDILRAAADGETTVRPKARKPRSRESLPSAVDLGALSLTTEQVMRMSPAERRMLLGSPT